MVKPGSVQHLRHLIRKVIYRLKRRFGRPIDIYRDVLSSFDPKTGKQTVTPTKISVTRAIVLPGLKYGAIFQSISFIKANSNFVLGGDVRLDDRHFIVDCKDIPKDFIIQQGDYLFLNDQKYDIIKVESLEEQTGSYLICRRIVDSHKRQIIDVKIKTPLEVSSSFEEG